jgi:hypothetical protein
MLQALIGLLSGAVGTIIGSILTWRLMTRAARNQARRETLVRTAEILQDYRVAYAQWYVEYLSPQAQASEGWARPPTGKPDPVYLSLMSAVDRARGYLRVIHGALFAYFPREVARPICVEIMRVLTMSGTMQADCRQVDTVVEAACDLIPDIIRRYS